MSAHQNELQKLQEAFQDNHVNEIIPRTISAMIRDRIPRQIYITQHPSGRGIFLDRLKVLLHPYQHVDPISVFSNYFTANLGTRLGFEVTETNGTYILEMFIIE